MQGRNYINASPISLRAQLHAHNVHVMKLQSIKNHHGVYNQSTSKRGPQKKPNQPFHEICNFYIERIDSIIRENKSLLNRLSAISNRKGATERVQSSFQPQIKSLNLPQRKLQARQIAENNEIIAKKLDHSAPVLPKKVLDRNYEQTKQYKHLVSKESLIQRQKRYSEMLKLSLRNLKSRESISVMRSKSVEKTQRNTHPQESRKKFQSQTEQCVQQYLQPLSNKQNHINNEFDKQLIRTQQGQNLSITPNPKNQKIKLQLESFNSDDKSSISLPRVKRKSKVEIDYSLGQSSSDSFVKLQYSRFVRRFLQIIFPAEDKYGQTKKREL